MSYSWGKISTRKLTRPRIEPGPSAWDVTMLTLDESGGSIEWCNNSNFLYYRFNSSPILSIGAIPMIRTTSDFTIWGSLDVIETCKENVVCFNALLRASGSAQGGYMALSVVYFRITHRLGRPHYMWDEYLYSVREKVEVGVIVSVTVCVVLLYCVGWWLKEGRRWNPVPAHSLLFSKRTKGAPG